MRGAYSPRVGLLDFLLGRAGTPPPSTTPPTISPPSSVPWVSGTTALGLSAVWRCVNLISDSIADLPWREWRGPEGAPEEIPISRLVRRPMATMTRREWTWRVVATEALYNTAYLLHVGGFDSDGVPWSLMPIPPRAILPVTPQDPWGIVQPSEYLVGGQLTSVDDLSIIRRAPFPGLTDYMSGILDLARSQFQAYLAADTHLARYWIGGGPTLSVITVPGSLTNEEGDGIAAAWADRRAQGGNRPVILPQGADAKSWGADPTTESAVDARREIVADIGRYFGVPSRILNAPAGDSETYANVENDASDLWRYTLRGYAGPVEDAISELLPGDYIGGRRMRFDPVRYLQGDLQSRAQAYPMLVAAGILSIDEARAGGFGLGPLPAADQSNETTPAPPQPAAIPAAMATVGAQ
jgi:HK97 family phage portal protein